MKTEVIGPKNWWMFPIIPSDLPSDEDLDNASEDRKNAIYGQLVKNEEILEENT